MSQPSTILFRCNVSASVGLGHLMRSRTFAAVLKRQGHSCVMVGPDADYRVAADNALFDDWHASPDWISSSSIADEFIGIARRHDAIRAVIDDYRADEPFQAVLAEAGMIWMQHFDASKPQRFLADMIVHGSPSETAERWRPHVLNPDAEMLFGPQYAVLRPEFPPANLQPDNRDVRQILMSFGGGDDKGAILLNLQALSELPSSIRFAIMSGDRNPNIPAIQRWIAGSGRTNVTLHIQPADVAGLFASCDLALLGGGISIYEAAACGLPMIVASLADNQLRQCQAWNDLGAAIFLGRADELAATQIDSTVRTLIGDRRKREHMSAIGRNAVDGRGAERLASHLLKDRRK